MVDIGNKATFLNTLIVPKVCSAKLNDFDMNFEYVFSIKLELA
jgi:hypothetical protein